jgi:two-component system, OmpR family, sensor histidine kinase KdpD
VERPPLGSVPQKEPRPAPSRRPYAERRGLDGYLAAAGLVAVASAIGGFLSHAGPAGIVLVYVIAVLISAWRLGRGPAYFAALLGVTAHAYFFVPPAFSLAITDTSHWVALATMTLVVLVVGILTADLRRYAEEADRRTRNADALRTLSREFLKRRDRLHGLRLAAEHVGLQLSGRAIVVTARAGGGIESAVGEAGDVELDLADRALAERVMTESARPDRTAPMFAAPASVALPLESERGVVGALLLRRRDGAPALTSDDVLLLEGFGRLVAEAMERSRLAETAERAEVEATSERLRNALLSSVSHDFRTPLAVIIGATSHLAAQGEALRPSERAELARTAEQEAERLNRLVGDLLSMTRLDAGVIRATKEWQPLEDVVGAALGRMERSLEGRRVTISLPANLPLVPLDAVLVEQVLVNLLDNATKHTPAGVAVGIEARTDADRGVVVDVSDEGPGLARGDEEAVFERFRRGMAARAGGVGLGLAVCRGIVSVHGGRIWAENRPGGGAAFRFTLPFDGVPPAMPPREASEARQPA